MSRKKWGKSAAKTERVVRDAVPKPDTLTEIGEYLKKTRSVTGFDLANKFGIRMSVAKRILREKEAEGVIVPYIRESGFVVYTTASELEKHEGGKPVMTADAIEEVVSTSPSKSVITDEMDAALSAAASSMGMVKPSKLARIRREAGVKKERKDTRPEVVVEPLETKPEDKAKKEVKPKKEAKPKKKAAPKKKADEKEAKPKKKTAAKKKADEKEAKPKKKAAPKKKADEKEAKPKKKAAPKKKADEKEAKPKKKAASKKKADEKEAKPKKKAAPKKKADKKEAKPKKKAAPKKTK